MRAPARHIVLSDPLLTHLVGWNQRSTNTFCWQKELTCPCDMDMTQMSARLETWGSIWLMLCGWEGQFLLVNVSYGTEQVAWLTTNQFPGDRRIHIILWKQFLDRRHGTALWTMQEPAVTECLLQETGLSNFYPLFFFFFFFWLCQVLVAARGIFVEACRIFPCSTGSVVCGTRALSLRHVSSVVVAQGLS